MDPVTVLLLNPNSRWREDGGRDSLATRVARPQREEHLGLGYLAASLDRDDVECDVIDADLLDLSLAEVVRRAAALRPRIVGISLLHDTFPQSLVLIKRLKVTLEAPLVVGGHLPTIAGAELLRLVPEIDYALQGEAEESLVELVRAANLDSRDLGRIRNLVFRRPDGVIRQTARTPPPGIDGLPFPRRASVEQTFRLQDASGQPRARRVLSSRGCSGACHFCSISAFYAGSSRTPRFRDEASVAEEIEELHRGYAARYFYFSDDDFLGPTAGQLDRVRRLAKQISARGLDIHFTISCRLDHFSEEAFRILRDAGLMHVGFGLENVDDRALTFFNKGCSSRLLSEVIESLVRLDISASFFMILYHPLASLEQVFQNYEFLRTLGYLDANGPPDRAFNLLVATRLLVRRFTPIEGLLRRHNLHRGYLESNPFIVDYSFSDIEVEDFWTLLCDAALRRPEQTVPIFVELMERVRGRRRRASHSR